MYVYLSPDGMFILYTASLIFIFDVYQKQNRKGIKSLAYFHEVGLNCECS